MASILANKQGLNSIYSGATPAITGQTNDVKKAATDLLQGRVDKKSNDELMASAEANYNQYKLDGGKASYADFLTTTEITAKSLLPSVTGADAQTLADVDDFLKSQGAAILPDVQVNPSADPLPLRDTLTKPRQP